MISPKLVEVGRHLNIELMTNTEIIDLDGEPGNFTANVHKEARYVDLTKCTSCGECAKVCPIDVANEYDKGLSTRKAVYKKYAQAIPGAFAIDKRGTAPCKATCPAHVSIQGFVALINAGKYREALALFKEEHPFPGACGRVCHHPCETECTRCDVEEPLAVQWLHRFLADRDVEEEEPYIPEVKEARDEKVAVIGSGPAGLTAAYFLAKEGFQVTVFEKLPVAGGMMAVGIPEYRLSRKNLDTEIDVIQKMGVVIKTGVTFGTDITTEGLKADGFRAIFVATGLHASRSLGVPGEELSGVLPGIPFLRDAALGEGGKLEGKVLVVGGGNVAVDVALTAKRLGADDVSMVCLEARDEMPAWDYEIEEAVEEKVTIINSMGPLNFEEKDGKVCGAKFKRCTAVFDAEGRFNPQYDENDITTLEADTVIIAIGQMGDNGFCEKENIVVTNRGGLEADMTTFQTAADPMVFAGGDAVYGPKSVVDAVACGKETALSIQRFIEGENVALGRKIEWSFVRPDITGEPVIGRLRQEKLAVAERKHNFNEINFGYDEETALMEAQRCMKCGVCSECYQCVDACLAGAIDHSQHAEDLTLNVGSVVLCPGSETYDPSGLDEFYHYKTNPNVLTSLEFERILSASGPTLGHLVRPSDEKEPDRIAWLQCVGSRDENKCGNGYCSSVCCMYAVKDAMIAKEHSKKELDTVIFNMDMRTFGKDYEKYLNRAKDDEGVAFVKARVHTINENEENDNLILRYADDFGQIVEEEFDMVVLSVGLQVSEETADLAKRLDVAVDKYKFAVTDPFTPVSTSRPGVFACGVFQGPKDIPTSVTEASAAACAAGSIVSLARGTDTRTVEVPEEIDVENVEPRVGVFVCDCGINIAGMVDVAQVVEYAKALPGVVYTGENLFTCSQDAQDQMKELIIEEKLNRIVVASCTPKTHEPIFMDTLESVGLNKYLFEMANIRNQNSWVHSDNEHVATEKAKDLVRMAVARVSTLKSLHDKRIPVTRRALVVGGGIAGMNSALGMADQGFEVVMVEKEQALGGFANNLSKTIEGSDITQYLTDLTRKVEAHPKIDALTQALIVGFSGYKGNFKTELLIGPELQARKIDHGVVVLATGASEYQPKEFLYGEDPGVVTQVELAAQLKEKGAADLNTVVMVQCVGSRNEENPNCSRICCQSAVKNAIRIKTLNPATDVYVLYRDMRMYGLLEEFYTEARKLGVLFMRFDAENPPKVEKTAEGLAVTFRDHVLAADLQVAADVVALSAGMTATDTDELSNLMKLARTDEKFFMEAHVKLRPVEMAQEGIFVCGTAHSPKLITETVAQSLAAASRATTFLSQPFLTLSAVTADVTGEMCASCLICVRSCPYGVPRINEEGVSVIDPALCQGCGVCTSECPAKAIKLNWYEDVQILSKVEALLEGVL